MIEVQDSSYSVNLEEAGKILGVHPKTVQTLVHEGLLPGGKPGRRMMLKREDVQNYLSKVIMSQTAARLSKLKSKEPLTTRSKRK